MGTNVKIKKGPTERITITPPYDPVSIAKLRLLEIVGGIQKKNIGVFHLLMVLLREF
jgi:hypothetical protein